MTGYAEIADLLSRRPGWGLHLSSAACAESFAPIFRTLGRPKSVARYDAVVEKVWAASAGAMTDASDGLPLDRLPEARVEDSRKPTYYAMLALSILSDAADVARSHAVPAAQSAAEGALNIVSAFDWILTSRPGEARVINPRRPPPPGRLEQQEITRQLAVLSLLDSEPAPSERMIRAVRQVSQEAGARIALVLPDVMRKRG